MARVTIRDVAAAAGVSVSAVSYILNGSTKKKYSEATVTAVRRAAEKLNYAPNSIARGMRSQKAHAIGVVNFWEAGSSTFAPTMQALVRAVSDMGMSAVLCKADDDFSYINAFHCHAVDGFVLIAPVATRFNERAHVAALREAGAPFVVINGAFLHEGSATVRYGYYQASCEATRYLLERGKKRIAYVDSYLDEAARELRDRREGYVDTMRESDLLPRVYELESLSLADLDGIEGIVTSRAETARALMRRLLDEGIRVPADIAVVAGSGEETIGEKQPPLTCVDFPFGEVASYSVRVIAGIEPPSPFAPTPVVKEGKTVR